MLLLKYNIITQNKTDTVLMLVEYRSPHLLVANIPHISTEGRVSTACNKDMVLGPHILVQYFTQLGILSIPVTK